MNHNYLQWVDLNQGVPLKGDELIGAVKENKNLGRKPKLVDRQTIANLQSAEFNQADEPKLADRQTIINLQSAESKQVKLRRQIHINRASWLANATSSPTSQRGRRTILSGVVSSYAVLLGVAVLISLTGSSQSHQTSSAAKLAQTTQLPTNAIPAITKINLSGVISR